MSQGRPVALVSPREQPQASEVQRLAASGAAGVPGLLALLVTPSWSLRRLVIAALADLGDAAVGPACALLATARDSEARIAALVDLLSASTGHVEPAMDALARSDDPAVAADAAQILGRRRRPSAVDTLRALAQHADDNVAVAAIEALGRIPGATAIDALLLAVESGSFFRTFSSIDVLGRSGDPRAVAPLARLLDDPRYALEAARSLGRTGDKAAAAPLVQLLVRPGNVTLRVAATALAELYDQHQQRHGVTDALEISLRALRDPVAVRRLAQATEGAVPPEQAAICRLLGALGAPAAAPTLGRLLDAPDPVGREAAAALRRLGQDADDELRLALRQGDSARRKAALPLLAGRRAATPELLVCIEDPDTSVRALACDALARCGDPSVVPALFPLLADPNARLAQAAAGAIQSLGSPDTERLTLAAAASDDPRLRRAALRIIAYFGYPAALDLLLVAAHDPDERIRDGALYALAALDEPRAVDALLEASCRPDPRARATALRALGQATPEPRTEAALLAALDDPDPWARYYACQALGRLAFEPASDRLATRLDDDAGQVRVAAVEALAHLTSASALEHLGQAARSPDGDIRRAALVGLGLRRAALPLVLAAASSDEPPTRLVAVSALACFDDPAALDALGRAAADPDESVRTAALGFLAERTSAASTRILLGLLAPTSPEPRVLAALACGSDERVHVILAALADGDARAPLLTAVLARMRRADATAALIRALSLPDAGARRAAASTLGALASRDATIALQLSSLHDPDPEVRRLCALALLG